MELQQPQVFKVIYQAHSISQYHPKATQDILWPCVRFSISLQAKTDQQLNLFEKTVLQLVASGVAETKEISRHMGLAVEESKDSGLAEFVCRKLQQLGLITERFLVTPEGEQLLDEMATGTTQVVSATVYFDLINRCWLPIVSRGELQAVHAERASNGFVKFYQGSVGKPKEIQAVPILSDESSAPTPNERDVIEIIKRFRQQRQKLKIGYQESRSSGFVTAEGTISVSPVGEQVFLHCYAFTVAGGGKPYVSNGFLPITQERFTQGFNNLKRRESNASLKGAYEKLNKKSRRKNKHQSLEESKSLQSRYQTLTNAKVSNTTERVEYENNLMAFVRESYEEIERILAECCSYSKIKDYIRELSSNPKHNAELARATATQLGFQFNASKLVNRLLNVNIGSVKHLQAENPVMAPLLLCHLLAARRDEQQPMAKLATEYPNLIGELAQLKQWRDPISHSSSNETLAQIGSNEVEAIYLMVNRVRRALSDWVELREGVISEQSIPDWQKDDIRREAADRLEKAFGLMLTRMSEPVSAGLFNSIVFSRYEDARDRTNAMAGALQHALYQACQALDASEAGDIGKVQHQLLNLGAKRLAGSNPRRVLNALQGVDATLGANFVAFWAQITEQQREEAKRFMSAVDQLVALRGHGGQMLGKHKDINEIERSVFDLIKHLMEQYCG